MKPRTTQVDGRSIEAVLRELRRPFLDEEVEWRVERVSNGRASLLCYLDSRAIQNRLDSAVGPAGWQTEVKILDGIFIVGIGIRFGDEWVWKRDGAGQRKMHGDQAELHEGKAGVSDALKRAAVLWGMGRHIYDLPETWVNINRERPPKELPRHRVVIIRGKEGAGWAEAPSVRQLQAHLLGIEDTVRGIADPQKRRLARIEAVRLRLGWPPPGPNAQIVYALEAASAVWEGEAVRVPGGRNPSKLSPEALKIASHRLVDWCEAGTVQHEMDRYARALARGEAAPPAPAAPPEEEEVASSPPAGEPEGGGHDPLPWE
jgi:hypothetical protein